MTKTSLVNYTSEIPIFIRMTEGIVTLSVRNYFAVMKEIHLSDARNVLKKFWGYDSFRKGQEKAIQSVIDGNDTLVLFPTGGGKSLCYQVPALLFDGLTLVISPLVALMQDQVDQLNRLGIRATFLNSTISYREVEQRLVNARNGMYKLLYIAPERLNTDLWRAEQQGLKIDLIAIDEAHCISEWGHDFRPAYRTIREGLKEIDESVRWLALTATATPEVKKDLLKVLNFNEPTVITGGFKRENLIWWVIKSEQKQLKLKSVVHKASRLGSGIIYSSTRKDCERWAQLFTSEGVPAKAYHAGLSSEEREKVQNEWIDDTIPLVTATNAFGMGIDKANCRYVVHYTLPFSLEAYYQEAGRAGRDGEISYPVLIYRSADYEVLKERIEKSYPDYEVLRKVYDALCDSLNLAVGSEHQESEALELDEMKRRTGMPIQKIKASFTVLERLGVINQYDLFKPELGIQFLVSRDYLIDKIDQTEPKKGDFLDRLVRLFGPSSFHEMQFLNEEMILEKLNLEPNQLRKGLTVLSDYDQLLAFKMRGLSTMIRVCEHRMQKLHIDQKRAYHYKEVLLKKLHYMYRYAETSHCREMFLRTYFGETNCEPCGKCDNCLSVETGNNEMQMEDIKRVVEYMKDQNRSIAELSKLTGWKSSKLKRVLNHLEREEQIIKVEESKNDHIYRLSIR